MRQESLLNALGGDSAANASSHDDLDQRLATSVTSSRSRRSGRLIRRPSAVVQLRRDHVHDDRTVSLQVDGHVLAIPPKLGTLLTQLAAQPTSGTSVFGWLSETSPLLYHGKAPHRPVLPGTLYYQLREHGIPVLPGGNTARLALAAELRAAVLASLTGIEVTTVDARNKRVGYDWAPYVAAKDAAHTGACTANSSTSRGPAERGGTDAPVLSGSGCGV